MFLRWVNLLIVVAILPQSVAAQEDAETQDPFWQNEYCVNPTAPYIARLDPTTGVVSVLFDITAGGKPDNVRIVEAIAADGDRRVVNALAKSTANTLKRWEYFAYIKDDKEAPRFDVPLTFNYVAHDAEISDLTNNQLCVTSVMPEPPSNEGDPSDPYVNLAQCVVPNMPLLANKAKTSGRVTLTYDVNAKGQLKNIALGPEEKESDFSREASRALKKWRYKPFLTVGEPIGRHNLSLDFEFGEATTVTDKVSCTHAPFGPGFTLSTVNASETCRVYFTHENMPKPSKGCFKD